MTEDGIHALLSPQALPENARKLRDFYACKPGAPVLMREFGFYSLERWIGEGHISRQADLNALCGFDEDARAHLGHLGWCEAEFFPAFEEKVIEDRGAYEVVQDFAGRHVLYFKDRRQGFMPEYLECPVKDWKTWEEDVKWRLDPAAPGRLEAMKSSIDAAVAKARMGYWVQQHVIGGYMYLRSLIGPEQLMYMFYDEPELLHNCMQTWLALSDRVIAEYQKHVSLDELFLAEDICYNHGCLISPDTMREFLLPYYQQLIQNIKSRQLDKRRTLHIQIDTDGDCRPVIPIYQEMGMDIMSPFEVASGCDVVDIGRQYPRLAMLGGMDKRVLATTTDEIDRMVDRIMPVMKQRGGFIPTCDHGVPEEVSFGNYIHFRKRLLEYSS